MPIPGATSHANQYGIRSTKPGFAMLRAGVSNPGRVNSGDSMGGSNLTSTYRRRLAAALGSVDDSAIAAFTAILDDARANRQRIWITGNGGSATTADHFATDLMRCPDGSGTPVRAFSLCSNLGIVTATANDLGYEHIFTQQLQTLASAGDILIAISASGNSSNILNAMKWAKRNSILTVALTGFGGGSARTLADASVHVMTAIGDYGVVEDVHLTICHMVAESLRAGHQADPI